VKAEPQVQHTLLDLAKIDAELARLSHRRANLPELAEVHGLETDLRGRHDSLSSAQTELADLDAEWAKQDGEIDSVRSREQRDRALLDSGLPGKQQTEIEHELGTLQRRQSELEDDLLELMERREALATDVSHGEEEVSAVDNKLADARSRRDDAIAELDETQARRTSERESAAGGLPSDLLALYERVRAQKGTGAALLRHGRCGACRLELDRSALAAIRDAPPEEVARCEECGAILVRTAESGL
jgi:predicted  nucleic acid-binding Zn-ribbon protein